MNYNKMLKQLALQENVSVKEIKREMQKALRCAGLNCSAKNFIKSTADSLKRRTIYSK